MGAREIVMNKRAGVDAESFFQIVDRFVILLVLHGLPAIFSQAESGRRRADVPRVIPLSNEVFGAIAKYPALMTALKRLLP